MTATYTARRVDAADLRVHNVESAVASPAKRPDPPAAAATFPLGKL
jgi:hypothetical protein